MKKLLLILLAIASMTLMANDDVETLKKKGDFFNKLKSLSESESREALDAIFKEHKLFEDQKYLLINVTPHPGLLCSIFVLTNEKQKHLTQTVLHANDYRGKTVIVPIEASADLALSSLACETIPYITSGQQEEHQSLRILLDDAIETILISREGIETPNKMSLKYGKVEKFMLSTPK